MIQNLFWHAVSALHATVAFARDTEPLPPDSGVRPVTKITFFDPLKGETLLGLLEKVLTGLTALAIPVVTIMIIIGAYYIMTSGGNPGRRTKGKDYVLWAAIGFAVLLLADSVVAILTKFLEGQ